MYFDSFADFLAMGKHGLYVWSAYGATAVVWVCYPIAIYLMRRRLIRRLQWMQSELAQENANKTASEVEELASSDQNTTP